MKKNFFILLTSILLLCSCKEGVGSVIIDDSDKTADARMEEMFEIIKSSDKDGLKAVFSKQALTDANDFDGNLDAVFNYIQGDIQSWEGTGTYGGTDEKNADGKGNRRKEAESTYILITSEQKYEIAIYEFTIDTANPDNVGVYSICIINKNDKQDPEVRYWGSGDAGIIIGE